MRPLATLATVLLHLLFWSWNLMMLSGLSFGLGPILLEVYRSAWEGRTPWEFTFSLSFFLLAPAPSILVGLKLARRPADLAAFFYGVEMPLVALAILRMGFLREINPGVAQVLVVCGVAVGTLTLGLLLDAPKTRGGRLGQLFSHAAVLCTGLWVAAILLPYAVMVFRELLVDILPNIARAAVEGRGRVSDLPSIVVLSMVVTSSFAVFSSVPVGLVTVSLQRWRQAWRSAAQDPGRLFAAGSGVLVLAGSAALTWPQPHVGVLDRLENPPQSTTERSSLLEDETALQAGLLDAALCHFRYPADLEDRTIVDELFDVGYNDHLGRARVASINMVYRGLVYPFVFQGDCREDSAAAQLAWTGFVDVPLQRAEAAAVRHAFRSTWTVDAPDAGNLDVDREQVLLSHQNVRTTTVGDVLTVTVDEAYHNLTGQPQEVLWSFALPASAAVHGLWLSDDASDPERFPGVLAPRGAAQQVYREQVNVRRDPALLEQVGPRQYRLRAFPVPTEGDLFVRWTYSVLLTDGVSPWPTELERRNVFVNHRTAHTVNGVVVKTARDAWFPAVEVVVPPSQSHEVPLALPEVAEATLALPDPTVLESTPAAPDPSVHISPVTTPGRLMGRRIALLLDTTRSMVAHTDDLRAEWAWIQDKLMRDNTVELYLLSGTGGETPRRVDDPARFNLEEVVWFGTAEPGEMLGQVPDLAAGDQPDVWVLWTDGGGPQATHPKPPPPLGAPLWILHTGGALAPTYDDGVLDEITRSGGGVAQSPAELVENLAVRAAEGAGSAVLDGRLWRLNLPSSDSATTASEPGLVAVATRQWIFGEAREGAARGLVALDRLHVAAKVANVVTPWSSLIALVDEAQRRRLKELEGKEDRFDRESETGNEPLSTSGVPEPEEWILLGTGGLMLLARWRRRRRGQRPQ